MARVVLELVVAVLIIGVSGGVGRAFGQSPTVAAPSAASPSQDCFTVLATNLFACLSFVEPGSNLSKPEKDCCPGLSGIVDNSPQCLCQMLVANASDFGFEINRTKALSLPSACNLSTPPLTLCSLFGVPVASPVNAEGPMAPGGRAGGGRGSTGTTPVIPGIAPAAAGGSGMAPTVPERNGLPSSKMISAGSTFLVLVSLMLDVAADVALI